MFDAIHCGDSCVTYLWRLGHGRLIAVASIGKRVVLVAVVAIILAVHICYHELFVFICFFNHFDLVLICVVAI